jgi:hypothetical protein
LFSHEKNPTAMASSIILPGFRPKAVIVFNNSFYGLYEANFPRQSPKRRGFRKDLLGIATTGNDGAEFSIWPWDNFGDHAKLTDGELFYINVDSLGKSNADHYALMAIDGNAVSMIPAQKGLWPVVMITAPADHCLGECPNFCAYEIPQSRSNPIRALVFDKNRNG